VRSVLGFVKVCAISLPTEMMQPRLASLIPNLMVWSHEHKSHFQAKVKHILDRMMRRFGFDMVNKYCPEADRKLITNIRKTKERNKRRKAAAKEAGEEDGDEIQREKNRVDRRFESEYEKVLYNSDSSEESDGSDHEVLAQSRKHGQKASQAFIVEDEDEPLNLLDRKALANISSAKPLKLSKPTRSKATFNSEGKLMIGQLSGEADVMEVDGPGDGGESGVGAYVAAIRGNDVPKRGLRGKLKWSNKRGKADGGDDGDDGDDVRSGMMKAKTERWGRGGRARAAPVRGRQNGRSGRGGISAGRRGLGEDKRRGPSMGARVSKPSRRGRR